MPLTSGTIGTKYYTVAGQIIAQKTPGDDGIRVDYVPDALGSVFALSDPDREPLALYGYYPYGGVYDSYIPGTDPEPKFKWNGTSGYYQTGQAYSDTYVRARHYIQSLGRWTTRVSQGEYLSGENSYGYGIENPLTFADFTGDSPKKPDRWNRIKPHNLPPEGWNGSYADFQYGSYCGSSVIKNPAFHVLPQDALDNCCLIHDRCIEAYRGAGFSSCCAHYRGDVSLIHCAQSVLDGGKCKGSPVGQKECEGSARTLKKGMWIAFWTYLNKGAIPVARPCPAILKNPTHAVYKYWKDPSSSVPCGIGTGTDDLKDYDCNEW